MKSLFLAYCLIFNGIYFIQAQDSIHLTKSFKFRDGLYFSFQSFQSNQPDISWIGLESRSVFSAESGTIKVEWIRRKGKLEEKIPLDSIWGLSFKGEPYIQIEKGKHDFATFAELKVTGKICYFKYQTSITETVDIAAYNPLTRTPYRKAKLPVTRDITQEMMLNFVSGDVLTFTAPHLLSWIADDSGLWSTVSELSEAEVKEKLYKCLLIYNDRNSVYVPQIN